MNFSENISPENRTDLIYCSIEQKTIFNDYDSLN